MKEELLMEFFENGYLFSTDKNKIPVSDVHRFLSKESYWAQRIPYEVVEKTIENSICITVYNESNMLAGFGRMVTDKASFGYLADIFIIKEHRGKGLSKIMMQCFCNLADQFGLRRFILTTQDAHKLYEQFDFTPFLWPERLMSRAGVVY